MEKRLLTGCELRAAGAGNVKTISGYAARYGVLSHLIGGKFKERIARGAFDGVLATKPDVVLLAQHDPAQILGRTTAGTLSLRADSNGLKFSCDLPDTQCGRDTYENVRLGNLNGCSWAFELGERDQEWTEEDDEEEDVLARARGSRPRVIVRTITGFRKLLDCSVVTFPAYPSTSVTARFEEVAAECRSFVEKLLGPQYATASRAFVGLPQSQIDEIVDTRDLNRFPLSGYEKKQIEARRKMLANILE
ncbi:MAG: HK97 family phage prohead protease [Candidatus Acidiferrum sp.]